MVSPGNRMVLSDFRANPIDKCRLDYLAPEAVLADMAAVGLVGVVEQSPEWPLMLLPVVDVLPLRKVDRVGKVDPDGEDSIPPLSTDKRMVVGRRRKYCRSMNWVLRPTVAMLPIGSVCQELDQLFNREKFAERS